MMSAAIPDSDEQVVLILVGLVASGKSTFAQALQQHFPRYRRCNQDDLGDRHQVERVVRDSLQQGLSVCVDRTNFNAQQRSCWINIAREFSASVWIIVFDTPYDVCVQRLQERRGHPTIINPEQGLMVLNRFRNLMEFPSSTECYDRIITLAASDLPSPGYTLADISSILERLSRSIPEVSSARNHAHSSRTSSPRRGRGSSSFFSSDSQSSAARGRGRRGYLYRGKFRPETKEGSWRSHNATQTL